MTTTTNLEKRALGLEEDEQQLRAELEAHDARKRELRSQLRQVQVAIRALRGHASHSGQKLDSDQVLEFIATSLEKAGGQMPVDELKSSFRVYARQETGSARGSHKQIARALEDSRFEFANGLLRLRDRALP